MLERRLLLSGRGLGPTRLDAYFNGQNGDGIYKIGHMTSADSGRSWTEDGSNPIISASGAAWVSNHVKDPWYMPGRLLMYVSGNNGTYYQIGRLTRASTASSWAYDSTSTPTIALGGSGAADEHGAAFPTVYDEGVAGSKRFKMWYAGTDASDNETVCYAYSSDGITWTKVGRVINLGAGGTWYAHGVSPAAVFKSGSTYYLFVGGRLGTAPAKWQGGVWSFTDPEGTYTAAAGNPTLLADFNTSGMSQGLTADAASGQAVAHVTTTSHWIVGMPMVIAANNVVTEYHRIASIDSSTQVTLDSNLVASFTTLHGAVLRPFAMVSVQPRTVRALTDGTYEMYLAAFQPVDDLTVTGETLWEGSMRATAPSLTGAWTLHEAIGLLLPLSPAVSNWRKYSAENPSVIAAP